MRYRFGPFRLDRETRQLTRGDAEVPLSRKAFDLLLALLDARPRVVPKDELRDRLWGTTQVVDANLNNLVSEIRIAIDDDAREPTFVRTAHRVGYAFHGSATSDDDAASAGAAGASTEPARCWLVWRDRTYPLAPGPTLIGRDPQCSVWIDVPGISRRHACVHVEAGPGLSVSVEIEDLASTNGTFLNGTRVTRRKPVADEAVIKVGRASLVFKRWGAEGSPTKRVKGR